MAFHQQSQFDYSRKGDSHVDLASLRFRKLDVVFQARQLSILKGNETIRNHCVFAFPHDVSPQ